MSLIYLYHLALSRPYGNNPQSSTVSVTTASHTDQSLSSAPPQRSLKNAYFQFYNTIWNEPHINTASRHLTVTAHNELATAIVNGFNQRQPADRTLLVAVDLSKTFDTVSHNTLLTLVTNSSLTGALVRWLSTYMHGREARTLLRLALEKPNRSLRSASRLSAWTNFVQFLRQRRSHSPIEHQICFLRLRFHSLRTKQQYRIHIQWHINLLRIALYIPPVTRPGSISRKSLSNSFLAMEQTSKRNHQWRLTAEHFK